MKKRATGRIKKQVLYDVKNQTKFVQIALTDYEKLVEYIEDIEDALDFKHAKKQMTGFSSLEDVKKEIKSVSSIHRKYRAKARYL